MTRKHILIPLGVVLALLIGVPAAALAFLHTAAGARFVESQVAAQSDGTLALEGLELHSFFDVRLARFTMAGVEVRGLQLNWSPLALLRRQAQIESLTVEHLAISQSAAAEPVVDEARAEPFTLPQLPELPVAIDIQRLEVETLAFVASAFGLEGRYQLAGTLHTTRNLGEVAVDIQAQRQSGAGAFSLAAAYGAAQNDINIVLDFKDDDGAPLAALTGYDGGALSLNVTAQGPVRGTDLAIRLALAKGPRGEAHFKLGYDAAVKLNGTLEFEPMGLGGPDVAAYAGDKIAADIEATLAPDGAIAGFVRSKLDAPKLKTNLVARAQGRVDGVLHLNIDGTQTVLADAPADLGPIDVQLRSVLNPSTNVLAVNLLRAKAQAVDVSFKGAVPLATPYATQLTGTITVADLTALAPDIKGNAAADLMLTGTAPDEPLAVNINAMATIAQGDMGPLDVTAKIEGTATPDGALDLVTTLSLPTLTPLDPRLQGTLLVNGQMQGPVGDLAVSAKLRTSQFAFEGAPVTGLQADINLRQQGEGAAGDVLLKVLAKGAPVELVTPFAYDGTALALKDFKLTGPGVSGAGKLTYNLVAAEGQGRVDLALTDLGRLAAVAGMAAHGKGRIGIDLNGDDVVVAATLESMGGADLGASVALAKANITTRLSDPMAGLRGQINAQDVVAGGTVLPMLDLDLTGGKAGPSFALAFAMSAPVALNAKAKGAAEFADETRVRLGELQGTLEGEAFSLAAPTQISFGATGLNLADSVLRIGKGEVAAAFTQKGDQVRGRLALTALDLTSQMPNGFAVTLAGVARIDGAAANPNVQFDFKAIAPIDTLDEDMVITTQGGLVNKALTAHLAVAGAGGDFEGHVTGQVVANLKDGIFAVQEGVPLAVKTQGAIRLAPFAFLVFEDGSTLRGAVRLTAEAVLAGAPERLAGTLCLQNFGAGLVATGTTFSNGAGCFTLTPDGAVNGAFTTTDGHSGKLELALTAGPGTVLLSGLRADQLPLLQGRIQLSHLRVMDGDLGLVKVNGVVEGKAALDMALTGKLSGKLTVEQGDLVIPANSGPSFTPLEVRHVGRPQDAAEEGAKAGPALAMGSELALDIKIDVPRQFFVRGRGIESEWKGDVAVGGTLAMPIIGGKISMVKGQATTGAAVLTFNRGVVTLVPDPPALAPIVLIDMVSEANVDGTTARMTLAGPVAEPKISFSSDPPLPEDEILARLLFGKPAAQMTASEALSMAGAALELSGTFGGGPGVLGQVRRGLGVDRLSVDASTDAPNSSSVSAGKYITPDLYMSVKQAADGTAPDIAVEYELTDDITVTGEQEGEGGESVGVRYEYDY